MTKRIHRALIIDDDADSISFLTYTLRQRFPDLEIHSSEVPAVEEGYDVYFIDNEFDGSSMAGELAQRVRGVQPDSLIIAFSGVLDAGTLKQLLNAGADGACDKSSAGDQKVMLDVVEQFLARRPSETTVRPTGLRSAIHSVTELLTQWNRRLEGNQRAFAEDANV